MAHARSIVAEMWSGTFVVRKIGYRAEEQVAAIADMSDADVMSSLSKLQRQSFLSGGIPATPGLCRERLAGWPSDEDLDMFATTLLARNGGVKPRVRVIDRMGRHPSGAAL